MEWIYELANTVVYIIQGYIFLEIFLTPRRLINKVADRIFCAFVWFIITIGASVLFSQSLASKILAAVAINICITMLFYSMKFWIINIAVAVMYYAIVITSDLLFLSVHKILIPDIRIAQIAENSLYAYMGIASQLFQLIVILIIKRIFDKKVLLSFRRSEWGAYLIFPLSSLILLILMVYGFDGNISARQANIFVFAALFILLLNLAVYLFLQLEIKRTMDYQKNKLLVDHANELIQLYDQLSAERDILGKREHEYKNMIAVMTNLVSEGNYEKLGEILSAQQKELIGSAKVFETGNKIINAVINTKYVEAQMKEIKFIFDINDLSGVTVDDSDLIIILANIFNNAIEACEKCDKDNRYIRVKMLNEDSQFVFSVANSMLSVVEVNNDYFSSRKKDIVKHGYGIENVKNTVKKNDGICSFTSSENEFISTVILPNLPYMNKTCQN